MSSRVPSASPLTRREAAQKGLVGTGERPGLPGPGQRGGTGQGTRFGFGDLEVVVQLDRLPGPGRHARMPGHHSPTVENHDLGCPQGNPDFLADEPRRNGILHHPHGNQRRPVHSRMEHQARIKLLCWQRRRGRLFLGDVLTDRVDSVHDPPVLIFGFPRTDAVVEFFQRLSDRHRGEPVPAEPTHFTLHPTLFVRPSNAGLVVERIKSHNAI